MRLCLPGFLLFLCILGAQTFAAQGLIRTDSLDSALRTVKDPNKKVDLILEFLEKPENQYLDHSVDIANRAFTIAQQNNYASGKIRSMIKLGNSYFRSSDYKKAMEFAMKSKELSEDLNFNRELANSLSLIGTIYSELGDYDYSSQNFFKSLRIFEKLKDQYGISHSLGDIGKVFYSQQDYNKALVYFNKSLSIATTINNMAEIKRQYNNIAVVYGDLQKYDTAIIFLRKALVISINLGDKLGQGINIMNIGYDQMNTGNSDEALKSFHQSLDLFNGLNNRIQIAKCYINIGFCYYNDKRMQESVAYFKKALSEGQTNGYYIVIKSAAKILKEIYTGEKDTLKAFRYVTLEKIADDSLFAFQKQKLISKLELQYIYEEKEFQRKLAQQSRNNVMLIIIFSLVFSLIILALMLSRYRLKSKFILLEKEKIQSELNIKNRELTVNLLALIKKNEMLSDISNKLVQLELNAKGSETKETITKISQDLRNRTDDKMLNEFSMRFQEVHAGFYEKLLKSYPDLTQNELKLCAFLRLNMSTKDISELTGQQLASIDHARYRLRKKIGLSNSEINLVTFLSQI
ncbi:MAG: tetratricopeptide repeat protein [Bacteroidetes bacterium]|nr:tetratricopeptide repeat protein [Bacteroidota bacterium]